MPSFEPTYTTPFTIAGDELTAPTSAVHNGVHVVGLPEQPVPPAASNAYNRPSSEPTYTTPFATAGDDSTKLPVGATKRVVNVETFVALIVFSSALNPL